jgi:hypothetical protein
MAAAAALSPAAVAASRAAPAPLRIVGGSLAQRQLARLTARRVGAVTIRRVAFREPSRVLRHEHVRGIELVVSSAPKQTLRAIWEEELFAGTYLGLMERRPKAAVAAVATAETEAPVARLRAFDVFGSNPRASAVHREVVAFVSRATAAGAKIVELRTLATPARALAITLRVRYPAAFLEHRTTRLLDLLDHPSVSLLGYYLGVENVSGRVVWAVSRLPNTGGVFAIPRLDACSPVVHSEAVGYQPPACPAR